MPNPLRIIVMGTGPFAVPLFEALAGSPHEVSALITQPPRPAVGNKPAPVNPMRQAAERLGVPVTSPQSVNTDEARSGLSALRPELLVVADYGQILKPETLAIAPLGGINLHGSLLPKYRGAAPINWAIYHGETEAGVTVIQMTPRIDGGPMIAKASLTIGPHETAEELEPRLAQLGAELIRETVDKLANDPDSVQPLPQSSQQATNAPRLKKSDGEIDWNRTAAQIKDQWRAMQPWPKCFTHWLRAEGSPVRLIVGRVQAVDDSLPAGVSPGSVIKAEGDQLVLATGGGAIRLLELQPSGKRMLSMEEFLRGYRVQPGDRFGATV